MKARKRKSKVAHYLVTVELLAPFRLHAYVMTDDERYVTAVGNQMIDRVEANRWPALGIILITKLSNDPADDGVALVRKIIMQADKETKKAIETATDFHRSIFLLAKSHPDDGRLMELH